jgi:hypothetical protein
MMQKSTKAALLSAFVFPGAGLLWLKKYGQAAIFIIPAIAVVFYILSETKRIANVLSAKIADGSIPPDISVILSEITKLTHDPALRFSEAIWLFIVCLVVSAVMSYSVGKKMESGGK